MIEAGITAQTAYRDDGFLTASGNVFGDGASCAADRLLHPHGIMSRPRSPQVDADSGEVQAGAVLLYWYEGSTLLCLAADDERRTPKLPKLAEGSTLLYADRDGLTIKLDAETGAIDIDAPSNSVITTKVSGGQKVEISATGVKIGDDTARSLGDGSATTAIVAALRALASAMNALAPAATPATYATFNALGLALQTALASVVKTETTAVVGT